MVPAPPPRVRGSLNGARAAGSEDSAAAFGAAASVTIGIGCWAGAMNTHEPPETEAALSLPAVIDTTEAGAPGSASEVDVRDSDAGDDIASADGGRGTSP